MNDATYTDWILVVFFFGVMCMSAYSLGDAAIQTVLRIKSRERRSSYEKWGVSSDLLRPKSPLWFALLSVASILGTVLTFLIAFSSTVLVTGEATSNADRLYYTATFAMYALFVGSAIESQRIQKITVKVRALDDLRVVFHQRFSISELLSVYEALRFAPPLFWEEYSNLDDDQISHETNRSYCERAAPYVHSQSSRHTMMVIIVAVLTLILTSVLAAKELLP